ncbi:hypothetical protein OBBRIDRAFT_633178 [Obba rivulosa]|uniref:Uncharacterized protein n=1 Tax=Obba rivulosa TaxID=1052685 RepID=A0A8E2ATD5_9APHY|nr:hypothetical protein OBBRIDRAFT_633178 [Obba rivulosa]
MTSMASNSRTAVHDPEAFLLSSSRPSISAPTSAVSSHFFCQTSASSASSVQTSFPPSSSGWAGSSHPSRPLPTPPCSPLTPSNSRSPRPLPRPPRSASLARIPPRSHSLSARPPHRTTAAFAGYPSVPSVPPAPKKPLHVNIPSPSLGVPEATQDTPPLSPITFAIPGSGELSRRREEALARHMKDLGFVEEVPPPVPAKDRGTQPALKKTSLDRASHTRDVVYLAGDQPPKAHHPSKTAKKEEPPVSMKLMVDAPPNDKRWSRKWVRECNGERLVEEDYQKILHSLRRLR